MKPTATYSETVGEKPFDWNKFLNKSRITEKEWEAAIAKAHSWTTCACGNQCAVIPRGDHGKPDDELLVTLGGDNGFYGAIQDRNVAEAKHFLAMIEIRSSYLIRKHFDELREEFADAVRNLRAVGFSDEEITDKLKSI